MRRFTDFDFGMSALAATDFYADWTYQGSRFDVLRLAFGADRDPRAVRAVRRDAELMRHGLSSEAVGLLWAAGGGEWFGIPDGPGVAHRWLDEVMDFCDSWLSQHDAGGPDYVPEDGMPWAGDVLNLVAEVRELPAEVAAALSDCVRECTPDLGLRWFIRALDGLREPVLEPEQYRKLSELADRFGYGEFVLPPAENLVADG